MSISLRKLYENSKQYEMKLVAGEKGLDNPVSWYHMVERAEISDFLEEYSIVFTTGIGLLEEETLLEMIRKEHAKKASGSILNVGRFIREIPRDVTEFCDQEGFPLFTVPWHISIPKMMHTFSSFIIETEKTSIELQGALKNAVLFPENKEIYQSVFRQHNFQKNDTYVIARVEVDCYAINFSEQTVMQAEEIVQRVLMKEKNKNVCMRKERAFVILFSEYESKELRDSLKKIGAALREKEISYYMGVGRMVHSSELVGKSYREAKKTTTINKKLGRKNRLIGYEELGIYQLLLAVEDETVLNDFYWETIGPVVEYDKGNQTDLLTVLNYYMEFDGSVNRVAEKLFLHRNTINYKIKKIEELLDCDLSDWEERTRIHLALYLERLR